MIVLLLVAIFILGPIAELYLLIEAGRAFGAPAVVVACIATAALGGLVLRLQGMAALRAAKRDLKDGRVPVEAAVDGVFLTLAAPLLMIPGFITDAAGFLLLVPAVRRGLARAALARLRGKLESGATQVRIWRG